VRYPFQSLLDALNVDQDTVKVRLRLDRRQVANYVRHGLTEKRADELAAKGGKHPFEVWPEMLEDAIAAAEVECADEKCDRLFVPAPRQKFCTPACQQRDGARRWHRRKYQDPEWRERQRARVRDAREGNQRALAIAARVRRERDRERWNEYQRRYYRENREAILAKKRVYDRARRARPIELDEAA